MYISTNKQNNCILLKNKKICLITNILFFNNEYQFEGISFHYSQNLYDKPLLSGDLDIYFVVKLTTKNTLTFKVEDILCKCFRIPYKNGFAVYPLCHTSLI